MTHMMHLTFGDNVFVKTNPESSRRHLGNRDAEISSIERRAGETGEENLRVPQNLRSFPGTHLHALPFDANVTVALSGLLQNVPLSLRTRPFRQQSVAPIGRFVVELLLREALLPVQLLPRPRRLSCEAPYATQREKYEKLHSESAVSNALPKRDKHCTNGNVLKELRESESRTATWNWFL